MIGLRRPSRQRLALLLEEARQQPFSYPELGATSGELPDGYRHDRWSVDLGPDDGDRFERAANAVLSWTCQRTAGIVVQPSHPPTEGATFLLVIRLLRLAYVVATARVVYLVEEADRCGFGYGTLTGHPERGEESFIVRRTNGRVHFEIVAFSRPQTRVTRAGAPAARLFQLSATRRYLAGIREAAR